MAIKVRSITCPNCGASVSYDESKKTVKCEFCGAALDMTEEYGPKQDRMRDDIQDMQIKQIMNNMNGQNTNARDADMKRKKSLALKIVLTIIGVYAGIYIIGAVIAVVFMGSRMAHSTSTPSVKTVEIDPFDKLGINFSGISGCASGRLDDNNLYDIRSLEKTTTRMENLSNGDTVTVKYDKDKVEVGNTKYILTQTEKTYTVSGLEEYVADIYEIGEEDLEILKKNAVNFALSECESDFSVYRPGTFEVCAIYSMVKKDFSDQVSVFVVAFDYDSDEGVKTGYFMAEYSRITKLPDGDYRINFNPDTYIYSRESYLGGFTLASAHSTWDATYADVYLNNKADWSVYENYISDELRGLK